MVTRATRRSEALSRERIVGAAVELLDAAGEEGLTFKALTVRLATGPGAIYWHVANKDELLGAATDALVASALGAGPAGGPPRDEIRAVALRLFDAIEQHPWLASQLVRELSRRPWETVTTRILERFGREVRALGVPERHWFDTATAFVHYVLGATSQTPPSPAARPAGGRDDFLDAVATAWDGLDPDEYPFTRAVAGRMRAHDDREQFVSGIDLLLAGLTAVHLTGDVADPAGTAATTATRPGSGTASPGTSR